MTDDTADPTAIRVAVKRNDETLWAVIDRSDYELVCQFRWRFLASNLMWFAGGYAQAEIARDGKLTTVLMHRLIMSPSSGAVVDHIDHDGLNNRRRNLRIATQAENTRWKRGRGGTGSKFKGIYHSSRSDSWCALIECDGVREHLGTYASEEEAARVYDHRARQLFGEFAYLNFPDEAVEASPRLRVRHPETRIVHGITADGRAIVKIYPGTRWYVEGNAGRERVSAPEAARLAALGTWHEGIPRAGRFDEAVRSFRSA